MKQLTEHFTDDEFRCRCCGELHDDGVSPELLQLLEEIRTELGGRPITIMSGYRCPRHNRNVGGARSSQHLLGTAADIVVEGKSPYDVHRIAKRILNKIGHGGLGSYDSFTHVDVRRNKARWHG